MPADLLTQLEMVGQVLDRTAPPLTIDELVGPREPLASTSSDLAPGTVHELAPAPSPARPPLVRWLALAAAAAVVVVGLVQLATRPMVNDDRPGDGSVPSSAPPTASTGATAPAPSTTDPLAVLLMPDDAVPFDLVQRFSSPLADGGRVWVYSSASTGCVCFVRHLGGGGGGFGSFDAATVDAGAAWSLEGTPSGLLLWGLTEPVAPVTVTVGGLTVIPDAHGVWSVVPPVGASSFTLTTESGSTTHDIGADPSISTTTVVETTTSPPTTLPPPTTAPAADLTLLLPAVMPDGIDAIGDDSTRDDVVDTDETVIRMFVGAGEHPPVLLFFSDAGAAGSTESGVVTDLSTRASWPSYRLPLQRDDGRVDFLATGGLTKDQIVAVGDAIADVDVRGWQPVDLPFGLEEVPYLPSSDTVYRVSWNGTIESQLTMYVESAHGLDAIGAALSWPIDVVDTPRGPKYVSVDAMDREAIQVGFVLDGHAINIEAYGISLDQVIAFAESIGPATPEEWAHRVPADID